MRLRWPEHHLRFQVGVRDEALDLARVDPQQRPGRQLDWFEVQIYEWSLACSETGRRLEDLRLGLSGRPPQCNVLSLWSDYLTQRTRHSLSPLPFTLAPMTLTVELTDEALARLGAAATARGVSIEELAAEMLSHIPAVDGDFASLVTSTVAEHRHILDSLAAT